MGCSSSNTVVAVDPSDEANASGSNSATPKYPPSEAFEIPIDDGTNGKNNNSIIQNHPPKRLQRLLEGVASPPPTLEELEDKLASAEVRRNQILAERTNSIRLKDTLENGFNDLENHLNDLETTIDNEIDKTSDKLNEMLDVATNSITDLIPNELKNIIDDEAESNDGDKQQTSIDTQQQSDEDNSNK